MRRNFVALVLGVLGLLGALACITGGFVPFSGSGGRGGAGEKPPDAVPAPTLAARPSGDGAAPVTPPGRSRGLTVEVVSAGGEQPIEGAVVEVSAPDGWAERMTTDAAGTVRIPAAPALRIQILVTARGFASDGTAEDLSSADAKGTVLIELEEAVRVVGDVVDSRDGRPVGGAVVRAIEAHRGYLHCPQRHVGGWVYGQATTDAAGRFGLDGIPSGHGCESQVLEVTADGFRTAWRFLPDALHGPDQRQWPVRVALVPGATLVGTVRGPDGAPVPGATVHASLEDDYFQDEIFPSSEFDLPDAGNDTQGFDRHPEIEPHDAYGPLTAVADASGAYALHGLGVGERYIVAARAKGFAPSEAALDVRVASPRRPGSLDLALGPACAIVVRCADPAGRPRAGVFTRVAEPNVDDARQRYYGFIDTGADGVARHEDLRAGSYDVLVNDTANDDHIQRRVVEIGPGENEVLFALQVVPPVKGGSDVARGEEPDPPARPPARPPRVRGTTRLRLILPEGLAPPEWIRTSEVLEGGVYRDEGPWAVDGQGSFAIPWRTNWAASTFVVDAEGFVPIVRRLGADPSSDQDLGAITLDPGPGLSGVVVDAEGRPFAGVSVLAAFPPMPGSVWDDPPSAPPGEYVQRFRRVATTGADGTFHLVGIPAGEVGVGMRDARFLPFETRTAIGAGSKPLRCVVRAGAGLVVVAADEDGNPVPRCLVAVRFADAGASSRPEVEGVTDSAGTLRVRLEPGSFRVRVRWYRRRTWESSDDRSVVLPEGTEQRVLVTIPSR